MRKSATQGVWVLICEIATGGVHPPRWAGCSDTSKRSNSKLHAISQICDIVKCEVEVLKYVKCVLAATNQGEVSQYEDIVEKLKGTADVAATTEHDGTEALQKEEDCVSGTVQFPESEPEPATDSD